MHLHPFIHTSIIQLKNLTLSTELISFPAESGIPGHTYKTHAHIKKVNSSFCLTQQSRTSAFNTHQTNGSVHEVCVSACVSALKSFLDI